MGMRVCLRVSSGLFAGLFLLTGCGSGINPNAASASLASTTPTQASAPSGPPYHAYGDSITAGYTLANPATQAYPYLVSQVENVALENYAIPGDQACDVPTRQIFAHADSPSLATPITYSLLIGTNDVDIKGTGAYESVFEQCHQAAIAWLALPVEYKVLAASSNITTSGSGSLDTQNNWNAWVTGGFGSSVSFSINTTATGPIYAWPRIDDLNPGTYAYSLDGTLLGLGSTRTTPNIITLNGTTNSLGFIRIPNVPPGHHVVTFTQTSLLPDGFSIVGIGAPPPAPVHGMPTVLVGTIPYQQKFAFGGACTLIDLPCLQYINDIESDVSLFAGDGLNVRLFDTRQYMFATPSEMNDALHPNVLGQTELGKSVEAVF